MLVPLRPKPPSNQYRSELHLVEQAQRSRHDESSIIFAKKQASGTRLKRWATKTKTGCLTCRERRVKCDEQKPFCRKCTDFGRECKGYQQSRDMIAVDFSIPGAPDHESLKLADALLYFALRIQPKVIRQEKGSGTFQSTRPSVKAHMVIFPDAFIMRTINHNIVTITQQNRALPKYGALPSINHLWKQLYEYVASTMRELNHLLNTGEDVDMILHYILSIFAIEASYLPTPLLVTELTVEGDNRRLSLESSRGRLRLSRTILRERRKIGKDTNDGNGDSTHVHVYLDFPTSRIHIHIADHNTMPSYAAVANTTSPTHDQVMGFDMLTTEEVVWVYSHSGFSSFPCATAMFLDMMQITRLRRRCARKPQAVEGLIAEARSLFRQIQDFKALEWQETYPLSDDSILLAETFKAAILLYGLLSLPRLLSSQCSCPDDATTKSPRLYYRNSLLNLVVEGMATVERNECFTWPIAVLGAAFYDGAPIVQNTLLQYLDGIIMRPGVDCGAVTLTLRLREFWESGKSTWEGCFYKSTSVLA